jgi:hypothetical protein
MYHAIETLTRWIQRKPTTVLGDILGGVALFAMLFILVSITT